MPEKNQPEVKKNVRKNLFRQEALGRMSTPDELDQRLAVASPVGWSVVVTLMIVIVAILIWGVFGSIPTHVQATGILKLRGGGVRQVVARGDSQVRELLVATGDPVVVGQLLALVDNPELDEEVQGARNTLANLEEDRRKMVEFYDSFTAEERKYLSEIRKNTLSLLQGSDEQIAANRKILEAMERLLKQHYTTSVEVESARERLFETKANRDQSRQKLIQLEIEQLEQIRSRTQDLESYQIKIVDAESKLAQLETQRSLAIELRSPIAGRIVEILAEEDALIEQGTPVVLVEYGTPVLDAVLYAPAGEGKRVKVGMVAQVAPDTVERSRWGTLSGTVLRVGRYPSTRDEMLRILNDENLVDTLLETGPPLVVEARLVRDSQTVSGYKWSSGSGAPVELTPGTLTTGTLTVLEQPPITLVIPALRRFVGIYP